MLTTYSYEIDIGGGGMCGVVFSNQPSVCSEYIRYIYSTNSSQLRRYIHNVHPGASKYELSIF
jgi:hypothetical protein